MWINIAQEIISSALRSLFRTMEAVNTHYIHYFVTDSHIFGITYFPKAIPRMGFYESEEAALGVGSHSYTGPYFSKTKGACGFVNLYVHVVVLGKTECQG